MKNANNTPVNNSEFVFLPKEAIISEYFNDEVDSFEEEIAGESTYYPHDENGFSELDVQAMADSFKGLFPGAEIENEEDFELACFIIDSPEKHIWLYSYINSVA